MELKRSNSDTISNVFLSTIKSSASTFLLESRELTLEDVNCLRSKRNTIICHQIDKGFGTREACASRVLYVVPAENYYLQAG